MASKGVTYMGGRIDAGYRGELLICLVNVNQPAYTLQKNASGELTLTHEDKTIHLAKGDKIAQISPFAAMTAWPIDEVKNSARPPAPPKASAQAEDNF